MIINPLKFPSTEGWGGLSAGSPARFAGLTGWLLALSRISQRDFWV
ncbi:MAG: hypothetical protein LBP75_00790 [Planctomycetota bacterium]|nr:hypothetical protein [Planctomycetota bacterium]